MWTGALLLLLVAGAAAGAGIRQAPPAADCATWQACREDVEVALASEAFERAHDLAWRAVQKGPKDDPALMFLLARAQSLAGRPQDALVMVRRLAERGIATEAVTHPDLARMRSLAGWADVEALLAGAGTTAAAVGSSVPPAVPSPAAPPAPVPAPTPATPAPAAAGRDALVIETASLTEDVLRFAVDRFVPAGLAYDGVSRRFVMGDQLGRKLRVVGEGLDHAVDLVRAESAGFLDVRALAIDPRRGDLWVATSDPTGLSGTLHRIQLISGRPLQTLSLEAAPDRPTHPVDLAIADSGAVFVLERDGRLLRARAGATSTETVLTVPVTSPALSLTLAPGDAVAYVSHAAGLLRVELGRGTTAEVTSSAGLPLTSLERLRVHRDGFVALQHDPAGDDRLLRLELSRNGRGVRRVTAYDVRVVAGSSPTALAVAGDEVSLVAAGSHAPGEAGASPSALGSPAELVVRRFRLR